MFKATQCPDSSIQLDLLKQTMLTGPSLWPTSEGTIVNLKCQAGYKWTSGAATQSMQCNKTGSWDFVPACESIFF